MPNRPDGLTIHIGSINICIGGVQIVNPADGGSPTVTTERQTPPRLKLLNNGVISCPPSSNDWYVVGPGTEGTGKLCCLSITYVSSPVTEGQKVRGRVYQGTASSADDPGYDANRTVDGVSENGGLKWTWRAATNGLDGAAYSANGSPNYCAFWIVNADNSLASFDRQMRSFRGIPSPYGSGLGSCGGTATAPPTFAAAKTLEVQVLDGKLLGEYVLRQVGPLLWRIISGPLKGHIDFSAHGDAVTVRTPFGEGTFAVPQERPFFLVLPGDLFGSARDVVVTTP